MTYIVINALQMSWTDLTRALTDYTVMSTSGFNQLLAGTPRELFRPGELGALVRSGDNTEIWLNTTRNQYGHRLPLIGRVLEYHKDQTGAILDLICAYGFGGLFGLTGMGPSKVVQVTPSKESQFSVMAFFRSRVCWVDPSVEDATVIAELEKSMTQPLMQRIRSVEDGPLIDWLTLYPGACYLVALALVRCGLCSGYSTVQTTSSTIIQTTWSETRLIEAPIRKLITAHSVKRLVRFTAKPERDDAVWASLFNGINAGTLRQILVHFGKTDRELASWTREQLIDCVGTWETRMPDRSRVDAFKVDVLVTLRYNRTAPDMLPWLRTEDLVEWLNPPSVSEPDEFLIIEPKPDEIPPSPVQALLTSLKIHKPQFVTTYEAAGYDYDLLEYVLSELNNPNTKDILATLTDPERMKIIVAWRKADK
jgi:hypothetical protein